MSAINFRAAVLTMAAVLGCAACSVQGVTVPTPTGPSELGLSLEMSAAPDVISQDGVSTSKLNIIARGPNGLPLGGVPLRVDVMVPTDNGPVVADYGTLSDKWPTTGSDGKAIVIYKAPPQPAPTVTTDTTITLRVTPVGSNYASSTPRVVEVLLVRPGTIRPPTRMEPRFTFSPSNPREHDDIFFDASSSLDPDGQIVSYFWRFGDGTTATGRQVTKSYDFAGTYGVVLTVTDAYGTSVSTNSTAVIIGTSANPIARFTVSPTNPTVGVNASFNAAASTATSPRKIVGYNWDLGDGTLKEGQLVSHTYQLPGSYTVTLVVTDDAGRKGVVSQTLSVTDQNAPVAAFTFSPTDPDSATDVTFNGSGSTVPIGRTIVSYAWDFGHVVGGSPATATGVVPPPHRFPAGSFVVTLTVTDSTGRKGQRSTAITVR